MPSNIDENHYIISEVKEKLEKDVPVLVQFQNGELKHRHCHGMTSKVSDDGTVRLKIDEQSYVGVKTSVLPGYRNFIAVLNKRTNKMRLIEVDHVLVHNKVFEVEKQTDKGDEEIEEKQTTADYNRKSQDLNKTFGSKRTIRRIEQYDKLKLDTSVIEDTLKQQIADIEIDEVQEPSKSTPADSVSVILPPCHRDAKTVDSVYILTEMISKEELNSLKEEAKEVISEEKTKKLSQYVSSAVNKLPNKDIDIVSSLLFVDTLITFLKMKAKDIARRYVVICEYSDLIQKKIIKEFCISSSTTRTRPLSMRDKAVCYIMAVSFICCNYHIDLSLLAKSTGITLNKLIQLCKAVGGVPARLGSSEYVLKLPLPKLVAITAGKKGR